MGRSSSRSRRENKGVYNETISVPKNRTHLTIEGATGTSGDVVITAGHAHGMINPATGAVYGTQGSATATFRPADLTVSGIKFVNSFNPADHPEIDQYSTQAVALAAMGDRQSYTNCQFIGIQDTVLAKSSAPTEQTRQYFSYNYISGSVDFIFGDATAVFDRNYIYEIDRGPTLGGNVLAPNTDSSKKYGLLINNATLDSSAAANTFTLGRTWHNTPTAVGQTLVRNSILPAGIKVAEPWTAIDPVNFPWQMGRFTEYKNSGPGSGVNSNRPQMSDAQVAEYTTAKALAGTDGWDPTW